MSDQFKLYGIIGTSELTYAEPWNKPQNSVEMVIKTPPDERYVVDPTGNWELPTQTKVLDEKVSNARRNAILKEWPIEKQMEALTENAAGRPEKLNQLKNFILQVKQEFPKK